MFPQAGKDILLHINLEPHVSIFAEEAVDRAFIFFRKTVIGLDIFPPGETKVISFQAESQDR